MPREAPVATLASEEEPTHGEFGWPVVAVDEWLAAHDADARPTPASGSQRTLDAAMSALQRPQTAAHRPRSLSPRGGH